MRVDLAARAAVNTAVTTYPRITDQIEVPAFVVGPLQRILYNHEFGKGKAVYEFACRVYVSRVDTDEAMVALDPYLYNTGSASIKALLDNPAGHTVSNTCGAQWTNVVESTGEGVYSFNGVDYLGAEFTVRMLV